MGEQGGEVTFAVRPQSPFAGDEMQPREVKQGLLLGSEVQFFDRLVPLVTAIHGSFSQTGSAGPAGSKPEVLLGGDVGCDDQLQKPSAVGEVKPQEVGRVQVLPGCGEVSSAGRLADRLQSPFAGGEPKPQGVEHGPVGQHGCEVVELPVQLVPLMAAAQGSFSQTGSASSLVEELPGCAAAAAAAAVPGLGDFQACFARLANRCTLRACCKASGGSEAANEAWRA
mmetsp:Transcript_33055/g.108607  ORF Transcript_33055/g.108607 Transcript_33055/m.108607 type:complete len:226 (+) Transcript_33055:702-1379(+)